jgi:hypothetical protein
VVDSPLGRFVVGSVVLSGSAPKVFGLLSEIFEIYEIDGLTGRSPGGVCGELRSGYMFLMFGLVTVGLAGRHEKGRPPGC